ncbi:hypothetical protein HPB51_007904 [Rhipicephalus microplus]|uniref:Peptide chain release factor domain-containing protein n=1 Tax=Rhipicephalus microplus TaxID=6941 RepID=A0A9J6ENC9_RHIMP|nr:hypothetical protein HPB51_007904 [Rhipicephalus microplus]
MAASLTKRRAVVSGLSVFSRQRIFLRQPLRKTEPCRTLQTAVAVRRCNRRGTLQTAYLWSRSAVALPDRRYFATLTEKDSVAVDAKLLLKYFQVVAKELKDVETELQRRSLDAKRTKELNDKVARLSAIVRLFEKVNTLRKEVDGLKDLEKDFTKTGDNEMLNMALDDLKKCEIEIQDIYDQILEQIVPPDPVDSSEVLLELTAGVGGQEAMLFTGDIMEMYMHYCRWKGWTCTPLDYETADQETRGQKEKKHTEKSAGGRSSCTNKFKAIHFQGGCSLPPFFLSLPEQVEVDVNPKDLVIKTKKASGPGGQHVNKTESAVQILHTPTGTMVESGKERSQLMNKEIALKILRAKLYQMQLEKQLSQHSAQRKLQVGSRGRSEKIRTYNYAQDRVTDHRIPITVHNIAEFLQGEELLDNVIQRLLKESRKEIVLEVLQPVVNEGKK